MEHTPQRAHINHPHDSREQQVEAGSAVSFVWAGEAHEGTVERVETDEHGTHHAHVRTTVRVPARATTVTKKAEHKKPEPKGPEHKTEHKPAEKPESKTEHKQAQKPEPKPAEGTHHRPATHTPTRKDT